MRDLASQVERARFAFDKRSGTMERKVGVAAGLLALGHVSGRTVRLVSAASIPPVETTYILEPYVPRGELTWFEGVTKSGKTFAAIDIISRLTRGEQFVTGLPIKRGRAAILTCEDDPGRTIIPRLIAAEAELQAVKIFRVEDSGEETMPSFERDLEAMEGELSTEGTDLLLIDGTFGFLNVRDGNSYADAYRAMLPLVAMIRRLAVGAIAVRHVRKSDGSALSKGIGSVGFASLARSTVSIAIDRDDESGERKLFAHAGTNVGQTGPTISFAVKGVPISGFDSLVGRVVWGEIVAITADEVMADRRGEDRSALEAACDFLQDQLSMGPVLSTSVYASADRAHISRGTLRRAAARLGVKRTRDGFSGPWLMMTPETVRAQTPSTCSSTGHELVPESLSTYGARKSRAPLSKDGKCCSFCHRIDLAFDLQDGRFICEGCLNVKLARRLMVPRGTRE